MYQEMIRQTLAAMGHIGQYDPRHVEAYIRLEHSTLDGLSKDQFRQEIRTAVECINIEGTAVAESVAESFGL